MIRRAANQETPSAAEKAYDSIGWLELVAGNELYTLYRVTL